MHIKTLDRKYSRLYVPIPRTNVFLATNPFNCAFSLTRVLSVFILILEPVVISYLIYVRRSNTERDQAGVFVK